MKRVVVTGMGVVSPVGNNIETFWKNISDGVCGIDFIDYFDTTEFKVKVAAQVKELDLGEYIPRKEARRMDKYTQYAVVAAKQAMEDAELKMDIEDVNRVGVMVGSGIGGLETLEKEHKKMLEKGPRRVSPLFIPMNIANMAAGNVAICVGAKGICSTIVTACATGSHCIGEAYHIIKEGRADVMFAGGTEAAITPLGVAGFQALTALSISHDPKRASIPFDKERDGFVMGEGAGILVLETLEHALKRGATIYAEVVGYGATGDAYHITSPAPGGEGGARAMKEAMEEANINKEEVEYINAHGTSTLYNDRFETQAIQVAFEEHANKLAVSSTKSMTGHLLGAAGAVEAIVCIKALMNQFAPPTIGYKVPDPECGLDYIPNQGRKMDINYAMSNSLGFGGHNAALLMKRWEG